MDVTKALKSGENKLQVMVVNSWRNRLIGDQELPEDLAFSTNATCVHSLIQASLYTIPGWAEISLPDSSLQRSEGI